MWLDIVIVEIKIFHRYRLGIVIINKQCLYTHIEIIFKKQYDKVNVTVFA